MQALVLQLTTEKADLKRANAQAVEAKERYKQQWYGSLLLDLIPDVSRTKAVQEVARVKNREILAVQERQQREARELQQLRNRYLAREESEVALEDKVRLREIRGELERFGLRFFLRLPQHSTDCAGRWSDRSQRRKQR